MKFEIIDYSEDYYMVLLHEMVPDNRGGKFVQIRNNEASQEFIVLSPTKLSIYHADIVEKFCLSMKIKGRYNRSKDSFKINGTTWNVVGGGYWVINSINKTLGLSRKSEAYGRFDSDGLKTNILSLKQMKGYTVSIDE